MIIVVGTGIIRNKKTKKREPFVIRGLYNSKKDFIKKLNESFDKKIYDFKTLKFSYDIILNPNSKSIKKELKSKTTKEKFKFNSFLKDLEKKIKKYATTNKS
jgi:hypothetical protein